MTSSPGTTTSTLRFRNRLLRDAAYDGLTFRLRRQLHNRAGDSLVAANAQRRDEQPELLSFHYLHAQRYSEAFSYALEAAEWAKSVYANFEAADLYERALLAGRRLGHLGAGDLAPVYEALGDARNRTGGYAEAAAAYRSARRIIDHDAVSEARLMLKLARVQGWLDRYANAMRWITKGLRVLEDVDGAGGRPASGLSSSAGTAASARRPGTSPAPSPGAPGPWSRPRPPASRWPWPRPSGSSTGPRRSWGSWTSR